jgi:predicted SprT family Zn-dependent metalloprotease
MRKTKRTYKCSCRQWKELQDDERNMAYSMNIDNLACQGCNSRLKMVREALQQFVFCEVEIPFE